MLNTKITVASLGVFHHDRGCGLHKCKSVVGLFIAREDAGKSPAQDSGGKRGSGLTHVWKAAGWQTHGGRAHQGTTHD